MSTTSRRSFLGRTASVAGAAALPGIFDSLLSRTGLGWEHRVSKGFGPLSPVRDDVSRLPLLKLPEGFRYVSHGWTGTQMSDGNRTPGAHDGMAVIAVHGDLVTICRNHELTGPDRAFADTEHAYDAHGPGGCTNLVFDTKEGRFIKSWASLVGTSRNCAGGPTPWGTWLSCEETVAGPEDAVNEDADAFKETHGWIFEVPAEGIAKPLPLKGMGRFVHEAIAVDPDTGIVYETEDRGTSGMYRYVPIEKGKLAAGGRLQMMRVVGADDLRSGQTNGAAWDVQWVDIEEPERRHSPDTTDQLGVFAQGKAQGGATFARLEGCWQANGSIYFVSTDGGAAECGQIWQYVPREEKLTLLFESPGKNVLKMPDNCCENPHGGLVLCEDSGDLPERLVMLTPEGTTFTLAENDIELHGELGHRGNFRENEWAGVCFSPDGKWLFVNIQTPGITFAITGPWERVQI
jgi:secreted PhoX family phosphatase